MLTLSNIVARIVTLFDFIEDLERIFFDAYRGMHVTSTTYIEDYLYLFFFCVSCHCSNLFPFSELLVVIW